MDACLDVTREFDFDVLEVSEATAIGEMGASSTVCAGSTCSHTTQEPN